VQLVQWVATSAADSASRCKYSESRKVTKGAPGPASCCKVQQIQWFAASAADSAIRWKCSRFSDALQVQQIQRGAAGIAGSAPKRGKAAATHWPSCIHARMSNEHATHSKEQRAVLYAITNCAVGQYVNYQLIFAVTCTIFCSVMGHHKHCLTFIVYTANCPERRLLWASLYLLHLRYIYLFRAANLGLFFSAG
jgi:hypothetical protein